MRFALISITLVLMSLFIYSCKEQNGSVQHASPEQEIKSPAGAEEVENPSETIPLPKEEPKTDKGTKKQRPKSALDTLRPKTA